MKDQTLQLMESWTLRTFFHSENEAYSSKSSVNYFLLGQGFSRVVTVAPNDEMIGFNVQRLNMKFLPVRLRIENKYGQVEELDVREVFQLYSRILKCNSLNWDKNYMLLTKDKRLMTMQFQFKEASFLQQDTGFNKKKDF